MTYKHVTYLIRNTGIYKTIKYLLGVGVDVFFAVMGAFNPYTLVASFLLYLCMWYAAVLPTDDPNTLGLFLTPQTIWYIVSVVFVYCVLLMQYRNKYLLSIGIVIIIAYSILVGYSIYLGEVNSRGYLGLAYIIFFALSTSGMYKYVMLATRIEDEATKVIVRNELLIEDNRKLKDENNRLRSRVGG